MKASVVGLLVGLWTCSMAEAASPRISVAIQEKVNGQEVEPSDVAAALTEELLTTQDLVIVEQAQLAALHAVKGEDALRQVITSVDADLVLAGSVQMHPVTSPLVPGLVGFDGKAALRVFSTDTAEVLLTVTSQARTGGRTSALIAKSMTVDALAKDLVKRLSTQFPDGLRRAAARRMSLVLRSKAPLSSAEESKLVDELGRLEGIESASSLGKSAQSLRLELKLSGGHTSSALATELEAASLGLVVVSYSDRELVAELDPNQGATIPLYARSFGASKQARMVADFARDALLGLGFLEAVKRAPTRVPYLELRGQAVGTKAGLGVRARVILHPARTSVASLREPCDAEQLAACAAKIADQLAAAVEAARPRLGIVRSQQFASVLTIERLESEGIFPSRLGHYIQHPFGWLVVTNRGSAALERVVAEARLPGLASRPVSSEPMTIPAGSEARLPLRAVFDRARLGQQKETEPVLASIVVKTLNGGAHIARAQRAIVVHERHAMTWSTDQGFAIAGFIDGHAPATAHRARQIQAKLASLKVLDEPFALPLAIATTLENLRYMRDPKSPFDPSQIDYVRYPDETLKIGGGDCDDLSVLVASMVEAAGGSAVLLLTSTHVFVAVGTGVPADRSARISIKKDATLDVGGELYLPLEATHLSEGFTAAWELGRRRLGGVDRPEVIELARARRNYPGAALGRSTGGFESSDNLGLEQLKQKLRELREARDKEIRDVAARLEQQDSPDAQTRAGTLFAQLGELDRALQLLTEATELEAEPSGLNNLGNVVLIRGQPSRALVLYEQALEKAPRKEIRMNAVVAAVLSGSESSLQRHLLELSPGDLERLWKRLEGEGLLPADRKRPTAVVEAVREAVRASLPKADFQRLAQEGKLDAEWPELLHWL